VFKQLLFITWLLPFAAVGQYNITGRVIDKDTRKPVAAASIFLSNASAGTVSVNNGTFIIAGVRGGQYVLVISIVGYAPYRQTILVNNNLTLPDEEISLQPIALKEVHIGIDKHWAEHYAIFKQEFLGSSNNAKQCKILNPHSLDFEYNKTKDELTASTSGFLMIKNKALGYKIKYMLSSFSKNNTTGTIYFEGAALFEDLPGREARINQWKKNREQAYLGSSMHFLRLAITNHLAAAGFKVERLIRKLNPAYTGGLDGKYIETLLTTPMSATDYVQRTNKSGEYAIQFNDCLNIVYNNETLNTSVVAINAPCLFFDNNGIILNPQYIELQGVWGESRMAELLPVDYESASR
jgi:hypothetical protein